MKKSSEYIEYLRSEVTLYSENGDSRLDDIYFQDAISNLNVKNVIDVGCGAGQHLKSFSKLHGVNCVGIDVTPEAAEVFGEVFPVDCGKNNTHFVRASGENIPFDDRTFDIVICRVALPYMDHTKAISEISRVLRPGGRLLLKTHTPMFYLGMVKRRLVKLDPKLLSYPIICLLGGTLNFLIGRLPKWKFWEGKETFQTTSMIVREAERTGLKVIEEKTSKDLETKSYIIEKSYLCNLIGAYFFELDVLFLGLLGIH